MRAWSECCPHALSLGWDTSPWGPWAAAGPACQPCWCLDVQGIPKISDTQQMLFVGLTFPEVQSHTPWWVSLQVPPESADSPYLARGFDSLKDAQINNSPRQEQAQTQVPADPPRIPNPRASLDVQDIPAREEGELLVSGHGLPSSRGPLTLEMPLLPKNLVNNHRHWQLLAKQTGTVGVISPPRIRAQKGCLASQVQIPSHSRRGMHFSLVYLQANKAALEHGHLPHPSG